MADGIIKDLGLAMASKPEQENQVEQYLNQHKFKGQSPQRNVKEGDMVTQMA